MAFATWCTLLDRLFPVSCSYLFHNPQIQWKHLQIYTVLFTGPLPISDTLKFPYMMHCCSDNKQVISWVRGQLPAGFDSLFLNLAQEAPYDARSPVQPPKLDADGASGHLGAGSLHLLSGGNTDTIRPSLIFLKTGSQDQGLSEVHIEQQGAGTKARERERQTAEAKVTKDKENKTLHWVVWNGKRWRMPESESLANYIQHMSLSSSTKSCLTWKRSCTSHGPNLSPFYRCISDA